MIINKQNLLKAGACESGADDAEQICQFPKDYEESITMCREAERNDLAAWMLLFKPNIIQTSANWKIAQYKFKSIDDGIWVECNSLEDLNVKLDLKKQELAIKNKQLFNVKKVITTEGITTLKDVDLSKEIKDSFYQVFNYLSGTYVECDSIKKAVAQVNQMVEQYKENLIFEIMAKYVSQDGKESSWGRFTK